MGNIALIRAPQGPSTRVGDTGASWSEKVNGTFFALPFTPQATESQVVANFFARHPEANVVYVERRYTRFNSSGAYINVRYKPDLVRRQTI